MDHRRTIELGIKKRKIWSQVWWFIPVILALRRWRQEDGGFEANQAYILRPCLKNQTAEKYGLSQIRSYPYYQPFSPGVL
jgi:hypothetical protein